MHLRPWLPITCWQANESVAAVAVEREYCGEPGVFFGFLRGPEKTPLSELSATLEEWKTKPVEEIPAFRRQIRYSRFPLPIRRFLWWYATAWSGRIKAKHFGTFGVSLTGASGATALNLVGPLTVALNTGAIQADGSVDVRMHFDHRVLDGMPVARAGGNRSVPANRNRRGTHSTGRRANRRTRRAANRRDPAPARCDRPVKVLLSVRTGIR